MSIAYNILQSQIILSSQGKHFVINREENPNQYKKIKELIFENKLEEALDCCDIQKVYEKAGFKVVEGIVHINDEPLPEFMSNKILQLHEDNAPLEPIKAFWNNLKQNPSYRARQDLYSFLDHNGHPFTTDGCFIAYKAVRSDFTDKHTGKMDNSVGTIVEMDRVNVDDNPNNTCSSGLHFGAWDYVKDFGGGSGHILEIKINPKDVVSIPTDYNNMKGRCCKFEVLAVVEQKQETSSLYNHEDSEEYEAYEYECECEYCGAEFDRDELGEPDFSSLESGDTVPEGSCPDCSQNYYD